MGTHFRRPRDWASGWEDDLPNLNHAFTARRFPSQFEDGGWLKEHPGVTAEEAAQLPAVVVALATGSAQAKLATRRLSMAMLRDAPDDQLIDACIGLEALLGQKGAEISYRVAVRAAALLSSKPDAPRDPEVVFTATRKVYDRRSELVHGSTSNKNASFQLTPGKPKMPTHFVAVWLLQDVLHERLARPDWKVEDLDARVLSGLASADPTAPSTGVDAELDGADPDET